MFSYTYEDVHNRLILMEKYLDKDINYAFKKLAHYDYIGKRIKKKFSYYSERIEFSMVLLFAKKGGKEPIKFLYDSLSPLFKFEVFYTMLFFPTLLVCVFFFIDFDYIFFKIIVFLFWIIIVYSLWFSLTQLIMGLKYGFLELLFSAFKLPVGCLRRNVDTLEYLYHTSYFHRPLLILMFASVVSAFGGSVKPRGFGGGSFGGGGAGGSW